MDSLDLTQITGHGLSIAAIIGALAGWFPPLAALAAFVWYVIQIYTSSPVQNFIHDRRLRRLAQLKKEMARLEAAELIHKHHRTPKDSH